MIVLELTGVSFRALRVCAGILINRAVSALYLEAMEVDEGSRHWLEDCIELEAMEVGEGSSHWLKDPTEQDENDDGVDDEDALLAISTYTGVTRDFIKTLALWVTQSLLVIFYIDYLNSDKASKDLWRCNRELDMRYSDSNLRWRQTSGRSCKQENLAETQGE